MTRDEAKAALLRNRGVSEEVIAASRELGRLLGSDERGVVPYYTDDDGPEVLCGVKFIPFWNRGDR